MLTELHASLSIPFPTVSEEHWIILSPLPFCKAGHIYPLLYPTAIVLDLVT